MLSMEKGMATYFSILAWRIPMDRGAWQATVHGVARVRHDLATKTTKTNQPTKHDELTQVTKKEQSET